MMEVTKLNKNSDCNIDSYYPRVYFLITQHNFEHNRLDLGVVLKSIIGSLKNIIGSS